MTQTLATQMPGTYIGGRWSAGRGETFSSRDPASGEVVWSGRAADEADADAAFASARAALDDWAARTIEDRAQAMRRFAARLQDERDSLSLAISRETGKPLWESREETGSMIAKIELSIRAYHERRRAATMPVGGVTAWTRFKPHGVAAVFGPFNFPGHLPNGHIVPAILAGNTVVFKPSELSPLVAQRTVELWASSGLPPGVMNLVQGGRQTGALAARHRELDGLFFTGSFAAGRALSQLLAGSPHKILALEMGGNNPLLAWPPVDPHAAAVVIAQSAYATAGQRCSCARRLIVPRGEPGDRIVRCVAEIAREIRVGPFGDDPEPFMGPVINAAAADRLLEAEEQLRQRGAEVIVPMQRIGESGAMLRPGIIDITRVEAREDTEYFGPLLQVDRVDDFEQAIARANDTAYGLVAALLCDDRAAYERFYRRARAGIINWNRPTTGASSQLPFGGIGHSGNHRPSGCWAADYCSYPVASLEAEKLAMPEKLAPGLVPQAGRP